MERNRSINELLAQVVADDLVKFGLIPELVGRLPVIAHLDELDEEQLVRVLTEPKNALVKQYSKMFQLENVELEFSPDALVAIAREARERKTGARGLRSVIEQRIIPIQYELVELAQQGVKKIVIDGDVIDGKAQPRQITG